MNTQINLCSKCGECIGINAPVVSLYCKNCTPSKNNINYIGVSYEW